MVSRGHPGERDYRYGGSVSQSPGARELVVLPGREANVGTLGVRRNLPTRGRRTVGSWCFVDHMGPAQLGPDSAVDVAPHPHIGLQTVTWLFSGKFLHKDSMGFEQLIEPGQLNLMAAGKGVVHAEEDSNAHRGSLHGMQLWLAQPDSTRHGASSFQHLAEVPQFEFPNATGQLIVGEFADLHSPARIDSPNVGVQVHLRPGRTTLPLDSTYEYALVVAQGVVSAQGKVVVPGALAYLEAGQDEITLEASEEVLLLLIGGEPLHEKLMMWWNFVARTQEEISAAYSDWVLQNERFGPVNSRFSPVSITPPIWFK